MSAIIRLYWQIFRLQLGPDAVPASRSLLFVTALVYSLLNLGVWIWIEPGGLMQASISLALVTGGWLLALWGIMLLMGKVARYQQTLTALLGVNVILVLMSVPLHFFAGGALVDGGADEAMNESALTAVFRLLLLGLFVWGIFIEGFIYHRALDISPLQGNLLALAMSMGIIALLGMY